MSPEKPRRLGRGLEALISSAASTTAATAETGASAPDAELRRIPLARIRPNPFQPRQEFDPADLAELESSLKASGLLQPITVRRQGDAFELIAGERRFRAASNIGWTEITAIVREFDDRTMLVLALVENLQRANLNPLEEARGYRRLLDDFQLTQQQVADGVGKDRTTITNLLRILSLPSEVQGMVERGELSAGHAKALLALPRQLSPLTLANEAVAESYSVRALEQRIRELSSAIEATEIPAKKTRGETEGATEKGPAIRRIQDDLRKYLQTDVKLSVNAQSKGKIELAFYSNEDLERLLDLLLREKRTDF